MKCPYCGFEGLKVVDSRDVDDAVRRRRECEKCNKRFTTYERVQYVELYVIKNDGRREPYDRSKITKGILKACEKRPISQEEIEEIIDNVEMKLRNNASIEVKSNKVGRLVMTRLKRLDPVAYIRFASVCNDFDDIEAFENALKKLKKKGR